MKTEKIICDETGCGCVVAERTEDGDIIIKARHHGRKDHLTVISPHVRVIASTAEPEESTIAAGES